MTIENKPIVDKVLESGLIDASTAALMEHFGYLAPGSSDKVQEDRLKTATKEELVKLADNLAVEVEKEHSLRETYLDLEKLRWPAGVCIYKPDRTLVASGVSGVIDRMGRYYFRIQDVKPSWFVPGYFIERSVASGQQLETIWQSQTLYIGDQGVCIQVSVEPKNG